MKNNWLKRRMRRKTIMLADWVFWDERVFDAQQMEALKKQYGDQPFRVMSMPYTVLYWGTPFEPLVDIGRMGVKVTHTNPTNLIKLNVGLIV